MRAAYTRLLQATKALVDATPQIGAFVCDALDAPVWQDVTPRAVPVTAGLARALPTGTAQTTALTEAVRDAVPVLHWQQSYTEAQVGAAYLAQYGWFNLVSPEGPFLCPDLRVSVGYWGRGLVYPAHCHDPEEMYFVLAGGARFETEGRAPVDARPGQVIHHPPSVSHGFTMTEQPLLSIVFWKGGALLKPSTLQGSAS